MSDDRRAAADARAGQVVGDPVEWLRSAVTGWDRWNSTTELPIGGARSIVAEVDRLRAELDRHRVAGDGVVDAAEDVRMSIATRVEHAAVQRLTRKIDRWRSVRGDAPAAGDVPTQVASPSGRANSQGGSVGTSAQAAAPTDGQAPADELRDAVNRLDLLRRRWEPGTDAHAVNTVLRALARAQRDLAQRPAVPADNTAAPDGPTADEAVASAARIVEAWAYLRMDTPEDQATHDELVRVSRATIAAYVRTRPWSSVGQPVRDSQPEATDAPDPTTVTPAGYGTWVGEDWVVEQRDGGRVSVSESDHRDPPGHQSYEFDPEIARAIGAAAARPVRDGVEPA